MSRFSIRKIVCDYGIFEKDEMILLLNDKENAKLILDIIERDSRHKRHPKAGGKLYNQKVTHEGVN